MEAQKQFDNLMIEREDGFIFQPCFSPVWDTAIATFALGDAGTGATAARLRARGDWLLTKEVRRKGDWQSSGRIPSLPAGILSSQRVLPRHRRHGHGAAGPAAYAVRPRRGAGRVDAARGRLAARHAGPATAAGPRSTSTTTGTPLTHVPFADHNAMLDPSCPDITGRVIEALCRFGVSRRRSRDRRGVDYLCAHAGAGRQLVRTLGRQLHLRHLAGAAGLEAAGLRAIAKRHVLRAADWLASMQNADGGWGESCDSYDDHSSWARPEHRLADRLGRSGADRRRR